MHRQKRFPCVIGWLAILVCWLAPVGAGAWPVPETGQTQSYAAGDDGAYTISPRSYTDNGDGTVTDNVTTLMWQQQDDGKKRKQVYAKAYCSGLSMGAFSDWRLPTIQELASIMDRGAYDPAVDGTVFLGTQSYAYWSSTPYAINSSSDAWYMYFGSGYVNFAESDSLFGNSFYVRCVRSGPTSEELSPLVINSLATATDVNTGLSWQRQGNPKAGPWELACNYCEWLTLDGFTDWRLPTINELQTIVNYGAYNPAIHKEIFPGIKSSWYWSATSYAGDSTVAWVVDFSAGGVDGTYKTDSYYVRCVRSGPVSWPLIAAPRQAATAGIGTAIAINWDIDGLGGKVAISLSRSGGKDGTWETISTSTENDGIYEWTVLGPESVNCVLKITPLAAPDQSGYRGLFSINTVELNIVPTEATKFSTYNLAVNAHLTNGIAMPPIDPSAVTWSLSDPAMATITGATLTANKPGWVTLTATYQGLSDSQFIPLFDLTTPDDFEGYNNDTSDLADPLPAGELWQGQILSNDSDWFAITLDQDAIIDLALVSSSATAEVKIEVQDADGHTAAVTTSQDGASQTITLGLKAGTSFIHLTPSGDVDQDGYYYLLWAINKFQAMETSTALTPGVTQQATLYSLIDSKTFIFQVQGQNAVNLLFQPASASSDYNVKLLANGSVVVGTWTSSNGQPLSLCTNLANGPYTLLVSQVADFNVDHPFSVTLATWPGEVEPDNTPATAGPLVKGTSVKASLPPDDVDFYLFTQAQPGLTQLALTSPTTLVDYHVSLYKGSEEFPLEDVTSVYGQDATLAIGLAAGNYLVKVEPIGDSDQQSFYTLTLTSGPVTGQEIEPNNTLESASGLSPATAMQGRIYAATDQDLYGFTLEESALVALTFTPATGTLADYSLDMLNAAGTVIPGNSKSVSNGAATTINFKPPPGVYFLRVKSSGDVDQFAQYSLVMTSKAQVTALVKLSGLALTTASETLTVGQNLPLSLAAVYSDSSSQAVTSGAAFVSSDTSVLTVSPAGAVTAVKQGHAMVTASWQGKAAGLPLTVGTPGGLAKQAHGSLIVVAGGTLSANDTLQQATLHVSEMAYQKFQARNFTDQDIYFMTQTPFHDLNGDGYDDQIVDDPTPTKDEVTTAINGWATEQASTGPLYLYLADHGAKQQFQVASGQILTAAQLNAALDAFQEATGRPVVVIIEACYSGSFVEPLTSTSYERLILTSVDGQNPGYLSSDGTTSYSSFLLANLYQGKSIADSLTQTKTDLAIIGLPYKKMAPQMEGPLGLQAEKVGGDFVLAGVFPELGELSVAQGEAAGALILKAQASSLMGGLSVWAVIVPPDYTPPVVSGDFETSVDELPTVDMVDEDPTTKMMDGLFVGNYDGFTKNGAYTVIFYAKDSDHNLVKSAPLTISVGGGDVVVTTTTTSTTTTSSTTSTTTATTTTSSATPTTTATTTTSSTTSTTTTTTIPVGGASVTLPVSAGWSLLSSTIGFQAAAVFGDSSTFTSVWKWTDSDAGAKTWAVYLSGDDGGVTYAESKGFVPLTTIASGDGFWVNSQADQQVQVSGTTVHGPLAFTSGWNLVGVKGVQAMAVSELGAVTSVWKWTTVNSGKTWAVNLPGEEDAGMAYAAAKGFGHFTSITPGEGFWVNKP